VQRIKKGLIPFSEQEALKAPDSFQSVHDSFIARHVEKQALRSGSETKRIFRVYVLPSWGARSFCEIGKGDVARLLDDIEDRNGSVMADRVLAALSKLFYWYSSREDHYSSPIVRGMGRTNGRERARNRILGDHEIRLIWKAAEQCGAFGALVRFGLLTGQRKSKIGNMRWDDLNNGTWTIPAEAREKANAGKLKLPCLALEVLDSCSRIAGNPFVFAGRGEKPIGGYSKFKKALDAAVARENGGASIPPWVLHDLRRTAKSLMARGGVRRDISERVLGHVIAGVEGVYDHHDYFDEKTEALAQLAHLPTELLS
jgi:integrase